MARRKETRKTKNKIVKGLFFMKRFLIVRLLKKAGYEEVHGSKHDVFKKDGRPPIIVPRHANISEGTAKKILKQAGAER